MFDIFRKTFPNFPLFTFCALLHKELVGCTTILDAGCGKNSTLRFVKRGKRMVGIDGFGPAVTESKKKKLHDKYVVMDVRDIRKKFAKNEFDAVVAIDVIEHLPKKDGFQLMKDMEYIARKKIIILTPNGFVVQIARENPLQKHVSGWKTEEFLTRGYRVGGLYGLKMFRKEEAELRFKPKIISGLMAELSHYLYGRNHPRASFSLLAVLDK
jgi:SAM-dependent methyltransferase